MTFSEKGMMAITLTDFVFVINLLFLLDAKGFFRPHLQSVRCQHLRAHVPLPVLPRIVSLRQKSQLALLQLAL